MAPVIEYSTYDDDAGMRVYSVCYLDPNRLAPIAVEVIDALNDEEAIIVARSRRQFLVREIWDRHRLVATIPSVAA